MNTISLVQQALVLCDEKGEYATEGLKKAVKVWEESSIQLQSTVDNLLKTLENS
jgi:hypothetical protein